MKIQQIVPVSLRRKLRTWQSKLGYAKWFYSCHYVEQGIAFYFNNMVHICCYYGGIKENGILCDVLDIENIGLLQKRRKEIFKRHRKGQTLGCETCARFDEKEWRQTLVIRHIVLNHFISCNLRCTHCGYMNKGYKDTKHEDVLYAIKHLKGRGLLSPSVTFDVGGGEPSMHRGLDPIIEYVLENGHRIHINSNGTHFVDLYAKGINQGLLSLTLTPDAGSPEVYAKIKGVDYCDTVWKNIARYVEATNGNIRVKVIVEAGNVEDMEAIAQQLAKTKVGNFNVDFDLNIPVEEYSNYSEAVRHLFEACRKLGIEPSRGTHFPNELWMEVSPESK